MMEWLMDAMQDYWDFDSQLEGQAVRKESDTKEYDELIEKINAEPLPF